MIRSLVIASLFCVPTIAAPPTVEISAEIRPAGQYVTLVPVTNAAAITYVGLSAVEPLPSVVLKDPRMFLLDVRGLPAGKYYFAAVATLNDEQSRTDFAVVVGTPVLPPTVTPPVVVPPVTPPVSPPPPPPTPTPLAGMRVLVIYETDTPLPRTYQNALYSQEVLTYLNAKCLKGPDGKTPERRYFDDDASMTNMAKPWQDLRAKLPAQAPMSSDGYTPQIAIGDRAGNAVYVGAYPETDTAALALLKQFGGNL